MVESITSIYFYSIRLITRAVFLAIVITGISCAKIPAASLDHFVQKYKNIEVPSQRLKDLENYQEIIQYFCDFAFFQPRHKVNPDFIRALILAESEVDPKAISHKNARGLGQILPETGRIAGRELYGRNTDFNYIERSKLKDITPADLHDPAINILLTCYLISKYNYQYDGKLQLVVSAWNAGENAINNNEPPDYRETLDLIGKINGYFKYLLRRERKLQSIPVEQHLTKR